MLNPIYGSAVNHSSAFFVFRELRELPELLFNNLRRIASGVPQQGRQENEADRGRSVKLSYPEHGYPIC